MNALTLVFVAALVFALAYRYYGLWLAGRVLAVDPDRATPAVRMADGQDYHPTNRYVLFGHHFAAIAAAGPLLGPVLAAQFGYLPGALWILVGAVLGGAVHDVVVLFASVRHRGRSLSVIAEHEIGKTAGLVASFAILFILALTLAGLSIAVVNAMFKSPWGTFTVAATIPIALVMGLWMYKLRPGDVTGGSILGGVLLLAAVLAGPWVAAQPALASAFTLSKGQIAIAIPAYGVLASTLPVWLLLCPRDYLSTYLKLGTVALLAIGIVVVQPDLQMAALTPFIHGGGPIIPGKVFPFVFITIACGALSGFHAVIGSGTTPKMIASEKDILLVGYGAMLVEGFVAMMALVAACVLVPGDYFAINSTAEAYQRMGLSPVDLPRLAAGVGEQLQGRPGGAVTLAVGMAHIFASVPGMQGLMGYWYHFAIMFEAVFILTAVDTGTRVGRYMTQELLGRVIPKFNEKAWMPGIVVTSLLFTGAWGYLVYTGDISTIWPLFGMSNQLLATCGLIVGTTMLIRLGKARYAWVTAAPGLFMVFVTMSAGYLNITTNYLPKGLHLLVALSILLMVLMGVVFVEAFMRWYELLRMKEFVPDAHGELVLQQVEE
jgi:carbon starvation protein